MTIDRACLITQQTFVPSYRPCSLIVQCSHETSIWLDVDPKWSRKVYAVFTLVSLLIGDHFLSGGVLRGKGEEEKKTQNIDVIAGLHPSNHDAVLPPLPHVHQNA